MDLRSFIPPSPYYGRPFTCDGLPELCTVIVIGENASTDMHTDWWTWWPNDKDGFNLSKFESDYDKQRPKTSPTRRYLRLLRSHRMLSFLETNVFSLEKPDGHERNDKPQLELLRWFLSFPSIEDAVVHGEEAQRWMKPLIPDRIRYRPMPHFSSRGQVSKTSINALAEKIKAAQRGSRSA
jgi:hypothetical protein